MKKIYEPEVGQTMFGQPYKEFEAPEWLIALLECLRAEVGRVEWNNRQKEFDPFGNTGEKYKTDSFKVEAYSWNDEVKQPYNFKWKDFEVSWYKYLGRGTSMNREIGLEEGNKMLEDCLKATRKLEKET